MVKFIKLRQAIPISLSFLALSGICLAISCATAGQGGISEGRLKLFPQGPSASDKLQAVPIEFWAKIQDGQNGASRDEEVFAFRASASLSAGKSLIFLPLDERKGEMQEASPYSIRVTPVAFYEESVALDIEILARERDGKVVKLSSPRIVAPYGESSELREFNPSHKSGFSDLNMSFLVGRPAQPDKGEETESIGDRLSK